MGCKFNLASKLSASTSFEAVQRQLKGDLDILSSKEMPPSGFCLHFGRLDHDGMKEGKAEFVNKREKKQEL